MENLARATRIALVVQKITLILCYQPLSKFLMLLFTPWFFLFDYLCVEVLKMAMKSEKRWKRYLANFLCVLLILASTAFVCTYYEAKTELDWNWAVQVFYDWRLYTILASKGIYNFMGVLFVFIPLTLGYHFAMKYYNKRREQQIDAKINLLIDDVKNSNEHIADFQEKKPTSESWTRGRKLMILGAIFAPGLFLVFFQPWMRLSATLLYDIAKVLVLLVVPHHWGGNGGAPHPFDDGDAIIGGSSYYNPKKDPYYVTNLKEGLDPRIEAALKEVTAAGGFRNIIHIALESMRADVFPYEEGGLLDEMIEPEKKMEINAEVLNPFLLSIKEQTLSFANVKTLISYTHKSMLGYFCGQVPLPVDFTREVLEGSTMYQTCWPNVLRQLGAIQDENPDELNFMNDKNYKVKTEKWDTANIASFTGQWDHTHQIFRKAGFETIIDAENILKLLEPRGDGFDLQWGYHDRFGVQAFWKYVDQFKNRNPQNRMLISWMGTTTHEEFWLDPTWTKDNFKEYLKQPEVPRRLNLNKYLNAVHWTDQLIQQIILGFRERGLEDDTLFIFHGDHGVPWIKGELSPVRNSHNEVYNIPFMIYNPKIKNPGGAKIAGDHYTLGVPTTILDLLLTTGSIKQDAQKNLAKAYAARYEYAQSFLRPMKRVNRMFFVNPGGSRWIVDNGHNLRIVFKLDGDFVRLGDYLKDPKEDDVLESYAGIKGLMNTGAEKKFGPGTNDFLKEAYKRHLFMKTEVPRRYTGKDYLD